MENILTHPDAHLWCIDTFGEFDGLPADYSDRWLVNTAAHHDKITVTRNKSQRALRHAKIQNYYDFAIVDGAHDAPNVLTDAVLCWDLLKAGGVMIFDDYAWTGQGHESCGETDKPRIALDAFCAIFRPEILHKEYQLILRKP